MRWNANEPPPPKDGETRVRYVFAWKPKPVENKIVWLESYEIHERYFSPAGGGPGWWSHIKTALHNPFYGY